MSGIRPRVRSLDLGSYGSARDFFEAVYDAAAEREKILRALAKMEAKEGVRAQGYEATGRSGGTSDAMSATDRRMEKEAVCGPLLEEDDAMVTFAESVIWGNSGGDMRGGVLHVMGFEAARVMERHYVHRLPWPACAREMECSESQVRRIADGALEAIDSMGWARIVPGVGDAT